MVFDFIFNENYCGSVLQFQSKYDLWIRSYKIENGKKESFLSFLKYHVTFLLLKKKGYI